MVLKNNDLSNKRKLLWSNPNPNTQFNPQTINLLSSDYDELEFIMKVQTDMNREYTDKIEKGHSLVSARIQTGTGTGTYNLDRVFTRVSDTEYTVGEAHSQISTSVRIVNNVYCIPVKIYGIKNYSH